MRNVVLVCLDSVRKDFFDEYAPRLRERSDVSFEGCRAASSWSTPSHASMLTGQLPHRHGVHTHTRHFEKINVSETFTDDLDSHRSIGISANAWASSSFGFDRFFDEFYDVHPLRRFPEGMDVRQFNHEHDETGIRTYLSFLREAFDHDRPLLSLANGVLAQVDYYGTSLPLPKLLDDSAAAVLRTARKALTRSREPYVAFLNLMDAHLPLEPTRGYDNSLHDVPYSWSTDERTIWELMDRPEGFPEYWERRRKLYGTVIDYLDRRVSRFIDRLTSESERETTVIITADHGENLGTETDEYLANHKSSLSEGLLHVPMSLINPPSGYDRRERGYVSHLDLRRLVVGLANGSTPDVSRTRVPAELVGMSAGPEPPEKREHYDRMIRCVYEGRRKIVWDSLGERTAYEVDPDRSNWQRRTDETPAIPEWASRFFETEIEEYKETAMENEQRPDVDEATANRLQELGYL